MLIWLIEIYAGFGMETRKWEVHGSYEQDALDNLIDYLMEDDNNSHLFDFNEEMEDDMVLTGGNCSDRLITYGMFNIKPLKDIEDDDDILVKQV